MSAEWSAPRESDCPMGDPRAPSFWWIVAVVIGAPVAIAWILGAFA